MVIKRVFSGVVVVVLFFSCLQVSVGGQFYENSVLGIKVNCPEGWHMIYGKQIEENVKKVMKDLTDVPSIVESVDRVGLLVVFSPVPYGEPVEYAANISFAREPLPPQVDDSLKYAKMSLLPIYQVFKDVKVLVEPVSESLKGIEAATFEYKGTIVRGYLETPIRSRLYFFLKGGYGYVISYTAKQEEFSKYWEKFKESLSSLEVK